MQVRGAWSSWNLYAKMMITSDGLQVNNKLWVVYLKESHELVGVANK